MTTATASEQKTERARTAVKVCDVIILGSGLAGSIAGAVLARHGADVVLVDAGSHPRFAIGESMTPGAADWMNVIAERYGVPEVKSLATVKANSRDIGPVFGLKAHFGFMFHHPGEEPRPRESTQLVLPATFRKQGHLYRQDTDSFMFQVAVRYGCTPRQNWRAVDVEADGDGVTVTGHTGEVLRGRYLIDASGFRSPLAEKFGLRETPTRLKHHSRSLFTHYVGVKPFDQVYDMPKGLRPPLPWHNGTMHHLIERGWFWIIPFDSYRGSKNPLCSVGLTIDERVYPKPADMTPDEEFRRFLDLYPAVKRQFEGARRVREWVSTDRIQYSSTRTTGDRWCLTSHAAGFIDPLWSRGLVNTSQVLNSLLARILDALKDDDFSAERFDYIDRLEQGLLRYNDDLVNSCFISFSDFRLWNAIFRASEVFKVAAVLRVGAARLRFARDGDDRHFRELENTRDPGLPASDKANALFNAAVAACERYEAGDMTADAGADLVFGLLRESDIVSPAFGWKDEEHRYINPTASTMARFMYWAIRHDSPEMRRISRNYVKSLIAAGPKAREAL